MSRDTLSDLLRSVRLRGAVFFYVSFRDQWSAEGLAAKEIAEAVMPGCDPMPSCVPRSFQASQSTPMSVARITLTLRTPQRA